MVKWLLRVALEGEGKAGPEVSNLRLRLSRVEDSKLYQTQFIHQSKKNAC